MDNNNTLIRIRYALDIKDKDMIKIFALGGLSIDRDQLSRLLTKSKDTYFHEGVTDEEIDALQENVVCSNEVLERFLNGLIIFKRGSQQSQPGDKSQEALTIKSDNSVNNVLIKKLKIALSMTSEDIIDVFNSVGVTISKSELGGIMRKEGHKHYRACGDNYARKFLKGMTLKYRKN